MLTRINKKVKKIQKFRKKFQNLTFISNQKILNKYYNRDRKQNEDEDPDADVNQRDNDDDDNGVKII